MRNVNERKEMTRKIPPSPLKKSILACAFHKLSSHRTFESVAKEQQGEFEIVYSIWNNGLAD